jgi:hypothetical protein
MPDVKISALPAATVPLAGTEVLPIVQSATTRQVSVANLTAGRAISASSITNSALTSGRVTYAGASGLLSDSANLQFTGSNLGIGTSSPAYKLDIKGGTGDQARFDNAGEQYTQIYWANNGTSKGAMWIDNTNSLFTMFGYTGMAVNFYTNNTERMRITSAGNVGIGTSSPATLFEVNGSNSIARFSGASTSLSAYQTFFNNSTAQAYFGIESSTGSGIIGTGSAYGMVLTTASTNPLVFGTNGAEAMRIDSNGLTTIKNANNTGAIWGECTSATFTDSVLRARASRNTTNGTFTAIEYYNTGAAAFKFYVIDSGAIYSTSIVITAISDERLKENIRDIDTGLSTIMALKPRRFDWKDGKGQDKKNVAGFIAQEFENVFPESVGTSKAGGDGIEYKNINHETLIPTLVKAMQEQQLLIESLTTRLTALENK